MQDVYRDPILLLGESYAWSQVYIDSITSLLAGVCNARDQLHRYFSELDQPKDNYKILEEAGPVTFLRVC